MAGHDIIVIGASAGGVEALRVLIKDLPMDLPAAILIVVHVPPDRPSLLPTLLNHAGSLLVLHPTDGTPIRNGCVYVAPPDHHMLIEGTIVRVVAGPRENRSRPAIDPLFRSAAACYGERVIGVLLSGSLDDGTAGMLAIRRHGGITVIQDLNDALFPEMPRSASTAMPIDHTVRIAEMGQRLRQLVHLPAPEHQVIEDPRLEHEVAVLSAGVKEMESDVRAGWWRSRRWKSARASLSRMLGKAKASANVHIMNRFSDELQRAEENASALRKVLIQSGSQAVSRTD